LLGAWTYSKNRTVLHTYPEVMPPRKRAWASWNYHREDVPATHGSPVSMTYHMNRLQNLTTEKPLFVTLNRNVDPPEEHVLKEIVYTHPVYTVASMRTQRDLPSLNGKRNTWFCGSYHGYGFHEDAVRSAIHAAEDLLETV
jgi:predicted NAD/FAD-binding protein